MSLATVFEVRAVASKEKTTGRDDVAVKVDRSIVAKARLIAAHRGKSGAALLSEALQEPIDDMYIIMINQLQDRKSPSMFERIDLEDDEKEKSKS